jgi:hypothetical protein
MRDNHRYRLEEFSPPSRAALTQAAEALVERRLARPRHLTPKPFDQPSAQVSARALSDPSNDCQIRER